MANNTPVPKNGSVPKNNPAPVNRIERALIAMAVTVIGLSILVIVGLLVAKGFGVEAIDPVFPLFPLIGLPIGILLIIVRLIVVTVNRGRAAKADIRSRNGRK